MENWRRDAPKERKSIARTRENKRNKNVKNVAVLRTLTTTPILRHMPFFSFFLVRFFSLFPFVVFWFLGGGLETVLCFGCNVLVSEIGKKRGRGNRWLLYVWEQGWRMMFFGVFRLSFTKFRWPSFCDTPRNLGAILKAERWAVRQLVVKESTKKTCEWR